MKKPSFALLRIAILAGVLCVLGGAAITFLSQTNLNNALIAQGKIIESTNKLSDDLAGGAASKSITDQVAELKTSTVNIQNSLNTIKNYLMVGLGIFILGSLILLFGLLSTFDIDSKVKSALKNSYEQGKLKGGQDVVLTLDKNPSVLLNMLNWVYLYKKGKGSPETAFQIISQFFTRAQENMGLQPYGTVGEIIQFDHQRHNNQSAGIKSGDKVRVIETGWKIGSTIIRKPMVERE